MAVRSHCFFSRGSTVAACALPVVSFVRPAPAVGRAGTWPRRTTPGGARPGAPRPRPRAAGFGHDGIVAGAGERHARRMVGASALDPEDQPRTPDEKCPRQRPRHICCIHPSHHRDISRRTAKCQRPGAAPRGIRYRFRTKRTAPITDNKSAGNYDKTGLPPNPIAAPL